MRAGLPATPGDWTAAAVCRGKTAVMFPTAPTYRPAKRICAECPVVDECREFALATDQPEGCWGGLDPSERRALVYERQLAGAGS